MFSLDGSEDSHRRKAEIDRHNHPRIYYSFLRRSPDEDTLGARIVFDVHPFDSNPVEDDFVCPADSGLYRRKKNACNRCRWRCASPTVLDGRRE